MTVWSPMKDFIPILLAFLGAGFGAYFAVVKSKREKLWQERYETLKSLVSSLNTILDAHEIFHLEELKVKSVTLLEKEKLIEELPSEKLKIRKDIAKLQLLFKKKDILNIVDSQIELNSSFVELLHMPCDAYRADYFSNIVSKVESLQKEVIELAQRKCI
jgi:hypothetical protein